MTANQFEDINSAELASLRRFGQEGVEFLLSQGMNYRTVARWVGDTEEVILQTYSHLIADEKDRIGQFLDSQ